MNQRRRPTWPGDTQSELAWIAAVFAVAGLVCVLWIGAALAALLIGDPPPRHRLGASVAHLMLHPLEPGLDWGTPMPPAWIYWTCTGVVTVACTTAAWLVIERLSNRGQDQRCYEGTAERRDVERAAGVKAIVRRGAAVRPTLINPEPGQVGYMLGRSRGRATWISTEDSVVVLGPPRSGKGQHFVIPMIRSSPGAVVTTSTRPDNIHATIDARRNLGPVAVFDPQVLAPGHASNLRWSPVRGCDLPQTAIIRARALAAGTAGGVDGADFWQGQTEAVLRPLLHAAALDDRPAAELYRWSLAPASAMEAVRVLARSRAAAPGWAEGLEQILNADPRTRDSIWAGVRSALAALADPRVLAALTPGRGEMFDPESFLRARGTLYLLGTSSGAGASANLISAYVEDIVEAARTLAVGEAGGRLEPPLALLLDEVANYPLPSLPALMSEGGGSGIMTLAVLQSLSQARARWGDQHGAAIWDASSVKVILGGGSNARDLADLSAIIGERDEETESRSVDRRGERSRSWNTRRVPIMDTRDLRTLPYGTAVLLLRATPPVILELAR